MTKRTVSGYTDLQMIAQVNPAFSTEDTPLVRYEMIREQQFTGEPVTKVAAKYNKTRNQFYFWLKRFEEFGFEGLFDRTPGPKEAIKLTQEVKERIVELRRERNLSVTELSTVLKEEGIDVSPASIDTVLNEYGLPKKKRGRKPRSDGT